MPPAIPVPPRGSLLRAPGLPRSCPIIAPCPVGLPALCWGQAPGAVPGGPQSHHFPQPAAQNPNTHNPEAVALLLEQGGRRDAAACPPSYTSWYFSRQGMKALLSLPVLLRLAGQQEESAQNRPVQPRCRSCALFTHFLLDFLSTRF